MVIYIILGYLIGFSIVVFWHLYKIKDYLEDITYELDREYKYNESVNRRLNNIILAVGCLHTDLENRGIIVSDEWKVSPEEAEKMYNAAQVIMREYNKKE